MFAALLGALVVLLLDSLSRSGRSFLALLRGEFGAVHRLAFLSQRASMSFFVVFVLGMKPVYLQLIVEVGLAQYGVPIL